MSPDPVAASNLSGENPSFLSLLDLGGDSDIVKNIAERLGSTKDDVIGQSRRAEIVRIRDIVAYLLREYGEMSYPAIGRLLGNRDHTTVIYAHKKIKSKIEKNPIIGDELSALIHSVKEIRERKTKIEREIIPGILAYELQGLRGERAPKAPAHKEIPERNGKILDLYREGLTLQDISNVSGVTRERVRQIVISTIKQVAINESISKEIIIDSNILLKEESKKRQLVQKLKKEALHPKPIPKEKRWSVYYTSCRSCGTTSIPHVKKGLCEQCAGNFRGGRRENIIKQAGNKCELCGLSRSEAIARYERDFYITKDKKVLCRSCFRNYTGKKLGSYKNYSWSRFHEKCKSCGTTSIPHAKKGLCENCSDTLTIGKREQIIKEHGQKCDNCSRSRESARAKFKRDLYVINNGKIVVCRGCFKKTTPK